jgi:MFS family permease
MPWDPENRLRVQVERRACAHGRPGVHASLPPRADTSDARSTVTETAPTTDANAARRRFLAPLALAQFICSFAGSNMNVMITDITDDLNTTVAGVQAAITLFLLVMAVLMIPCSKLTDRWGRKRCFTMGLVLYGIGALLSAVSPGLGVLILGNSIFEGVGTALLIPPVYILTTLRFGDLTSRARAFGVISGLGGLGAAAGPLIGGVITTAISWRAAFVFQAAVVALIVVLSRRVEDPIAPDPDRPFDAVGAVLSAVGMFFVVFGILQADRDPLLMVVLVVAGAAFLAAFFRHIRRRERAGKDALLSTGLFKNRTSNFGLVTQNIQWLLLMGTSFVVAVFLQEVRGYNAIETGVVFTAATVGVLASSLAAERLAKRYPQRTLIITGFVVTGAGIGLLIALVGASSRVVAFAPGLLLIGLGLGVMLTPSVNVVQSSFPERLQGEISGLSRSISNLGSSFGTAVAGTILVSDLGSGNTSYVIAMIVLATLAVVGLVAAFRLPAEAAPKGAAARVDLGAAAEHG